MKANEAPKKIYIGIVPSDFGNYKYTTVGKDFPDAVEYTRTDAFFEKACEYFRRSLEDTKVIDDYRNILVRGIQASYTSVEEFNDDFKNYMKGE